MNDLLFAVKGQEPAGASRARNAESPGFDVEAGFTAQQSQKGKEMDGFFARVEEIKVDLAEIKAKQREIQQQHERSKTIVRKQEMQRHREEMQVGGVRPGVSHSSVSCIMTCSREVVSHSTQ